MSLRTVDIWSKIGLGFGSALALALFVADLSVWLVNGTGALAGPFHGLALVAVLLLLGGGGGLRIAVWLGRRQEQFAATIMRAEESIGAPASEGGEVVPMPSPETVANIRRLAVRLTD